MTTHLDPLTELLLKEKGEDLTETKLTSTSTVTRQTKIKKAAGQLVSTQARRMNDPLYKKMIYYRDLHERYRALLKKKYGNRAMSQARK